MTIRRAIFWTHLAIGLAAGLFILIMSVTGVLLTYERQMVRWAQDAAVSAPAGAEPLGYDELAQAAFAAGASPGHVMTVPDGRSGAVEISAGRRNSFLIDPYSGETMPEAGQAMKAFFGRVTQIHRWLAFTGNRNETAAAFNAAANLAFALLVLTGIVLWWPRLWKWAVVRSQLLFRLRHPSAKARHYNWHHVAGIWFALPLLAITLSGAVFSYSWANRLVYAAFGEAVPARGGPPQQQSANARRAALPVAAGDPASLDELVALATDEAGRGRRISITLPEPGAATVRIAVDGGNGVQTARIHTLDLLRDGSGIVETAAAAPAGRASQARRFIRFLHTGEIFGLAGQTLAGLASLFAALLVYTGLCLGLARLARMIRQARRKPAGGAPLTGS